MKSKTFAIVLLVLILFCTSACTGGEIKNTADSSLSEIEIISSDDIAEIKNNTKLPLDASEQLQQLAIAENIMKAYGYLDTSEQLQQLAVAENIMRAYGYDEDFIEQLPVEKKLNFLQFDNAEIVTSYYRVNQDGSKMQLSKEDYLIEQNDADMPLEDDSGTDTVNNGYLTATHVRSYYTGSNGKYALSGNFKWSSYPKWQYTDIIAIYSDKMNMLPDSEYGQISCKINGKIRLESFDRMDDYDVLGNMYSLGMKIYNPSMTETAKGLSLYISADAQVGYFTKSLSAYSGSIYFQNHKFFKHTPKLSFKGMGDVSIEPENAYNKTQCQFVLNYTPDSY